MEQTTPQPEWQRLFCMIYKRLKENRTNGPTTVMSTPFCQVCDNWGQYNGYKLYIRASLNANARYPARYPENYIAAVTKGKGSKELIRMHHIDGITAGKPEVVHDLLIALNDDPTYNLEFFGGKDI